MTPKTLTKERREKFIEILNDFSVFIRHLPNEKDREEWTKKLADALANASLSRTELKTDELQAIYTAADKEVDTIIRFNELAKQAESEGKAWRGREFLVGSEYCKYGDWFHAKTGWQMYGARSKAKQDSTAMTEFKKWWEDDVTLETLDKAYEVENDWRKARSGLDQNITHPRELTPKAIAIQAAPQVKNTQDNPEGKGFYV